MRVGRHLSAIAALTVAAALAAAALAVAPPSGAQASHNCGPGMYWNTEDNACDDLPTKPPPTATPPPTPQPAFHEVCNPFCNAYLSRTWTRAVAAEFDKYQNTTTATVSLVAAVVCVPLGALGVIPGVICAAAVGLYAVDVGYTIDMYHYAAANNECMRIPLYVPWNDPIPYTGPECWN